MNIVLLCNSDLRGGAAVVTYRLMCALCDIGHNARMLVLNKLSDDPRVSVLGSRLGRKARFLAERAYIFTHNGFDRRDLFKVSVANTGFDISRHPLVKEADGVILSWINQGMLSLDDIPHDKRLLWIMHDMWCMTGICHHALSCTGYMDRCGCCPYIHSPRKPDDLSRKILERKSIAYDRLEDATWIAVSNWLAGCARNSTLLGNRDIKVIHNAFPDHLFHTAPNPAIILPDGIDTTKRLIVMGAARLDDPIKSLPTAIAAMNRLAEQRPDIAATSQMVLYGDLRDVTSLDNLKFPYVHTGPIAAPGVIAQIYSAATVALSTSLFETLPGTLIEGMASGCTAVTTGNGGQRDIVEDNVTGYITDHDPSSIASALAKAIDNPFDRETQHRTVAEKFGQKKIAEQIVSLLQPAR